MKDFILNDKRFLAYYLGLWLIATAGLFLVLDKVTDWGWQVILVDSLCSALSFFVIFLALWYVVRFSGGYSEKSPEKLLTSLIAALFLLGAWVYFCLTLTCLCTSFTQGYVDFIRKSLWIRALVGYVFAILINLMFYNFYLIRYSREALERENQLKDLVQRTELQALKNQLNPHFIYNSLNSISSLTLTAPDKAREMVIRLSDFLRYALKQDAMQMAPLEKELENIESYLQIEKVRFGEKLGYTFEIDLGLRGQSLPVMILQPLFENAVKHGVQKSAEPVNIHFSVEQAGGDVKLRVSNAYDAQFARFRSEGIGLENIRNRLRLIFGNGNLLTIRAEQGVFSASLSLPVKNYYEKLQSPDY